MSEKKICKGEQRFSLLTVFLQPRCQDLSLGFCPLEPQPKSEERDRSRVVDVLSTMFPY